MNAPPTPIRYHAVSMELAAFLDGRYVEMRVLTDHGEIVTIACDKNSIFAVQRHIQQLGRECPEISTWMTVKDEASIRECDLNSYEATLSEGWPASAHEA
ncbi:MAG: hypothetical protein ACLQME_24920 [Alphaproteobacteria bacterium]